MEEQVKSGQEIPPKAAIEVKPAVNKGPTTGAAEPRGAEPAGKTSAEKGSTEKESTGKASAGKGPEFRAPEFKTPDPIKRAIDRSLESITKMIPGLSKFVAKSILALTVLTGFAKKETQEPVGNEPPKATLTVGTLGMRLMKASINNGDKSTDFEANMVLAQGAKEVVGKVFPEEEQNKLFEEKPIEKGVFGEKTKEALSKIPSKAAPQEMSVADMAKASGRTPGSR